MIVAIISDIHGNLPALEAVASKIRHVDATICLGDVVNYGPWNDECLDLVFKMPQITLLEGNHEGLFLGKVALHHELPLVQKFYHASFAHFKRSDLISNLPIKTNVGTFHCEHTINGKKIYKDTDIEVHCDCIIGHTHHAFNIERRGHKIINPGSVGQNRRHLNIACYALYDSDTRCITLNQVRYDAGILLDEMRKLNYPKECMEYYESKL